MVMVFTVYGVVLKILEGIIHPAHHPFHPKAQSAGKYRSRYPIKGTALFSNGLHTFKITVNGLIKIFQKGDRTKVFPSAKGIGA
ncbi:hypothetical protein D9M68_667720 [compost metagenome]